MVKNKRMLVGASLLAADFMNLGKDMKRMEEAGADFFHIDMMDGKLVEDMAFGTNNILVIEQYADIDVDVHMMIAEPSKFVDRVIESGVKRITIQYESHDRTYCLLKKIKAAGKNAGISIAPETPVSALSTIVNWVDRVLLVCVPLGVGGMPFIEECYNKIKELQVLRENQKLNFDIGIDGGIAEKNIDQIINLGADYTVAGTYLLKNDDPAWCVRRIKGLV